MLYANETAKENLKEKEPCYKAISKSNAKLLRSNPKRIPYHFASTKAHQANHESKQYKNLSFEIKLPNQL